MGFLVITLSLLYLSPGMYVQREIVHVHGSNARLMFFYVGIRSEFLLNHL